MVIPHSFVTTVKERVPTECDKYILLPALTKAKPGSLASTEWMKANWWMFNLNVKACDKPEAVALALELEQAYTADENHPRIAPILARLRELRQKPFHELSPRERWERLALGLPEYGLRFGAEEIIRTAFSKYRGRILEALCGFRSFFPPLSGREVTALDYSKNALQRYSYPERARLCGDLNDLDGKRRLPFENGHFDAVTVCFGYHYPNELGRLLKEFHRILKKESGVLAFVENPWTQGVVSARRKFSAAQATKNFLRAGFRKVSVAILPTITDARFVEMDNVDYHLEAFR